MTLELENPPLAGGINLNSSYNVPEFRDVGEVLISNSNPKKYSLSKKERFARKNPERQEDMSARYSDDYESYEEDFESSSPDRRPRRNSSRYSSRYSRVSPSYIGPSRSNKRSSRRDFESRTQSRRDSLASYRSAYGTYRGPPKRGKKSYSAATKATSKSKGESKMIHRVLSASRNKVSRLHNIVEELQQKADHLRKDNKALKTVNVRQEKELRKVEGEEADLPILLDRHSAEMRTLRERLRRNQDILRKREREAQSQDSEILKLRDKLKDLKSLAQDKKLEERAVLSKKLEKVENTVAEKDKKIMDLEKTLTLKEKARQRELKEQRGRYKQAKDELQRFRQDFEALRVRLQEKEKELEEKNIYHHHIMQKKKKGQTLALPMAAPVPPQEQRSGAKEPLKRPNIFLTNAPSDTASQVSGPSARGLDPGSDKSVKVEVSALEREAAERERRRIEEEDARKRREDEERKQEEEERRRKKEEEERKREEEEEMREREEEERVRRKKGEEERKRQEAEEDEIRRKKNLLLARMRAIDGNKEDKPSEDILEASKQAKPSKLPIFLQSDKPQRSDEIGRKKDENTVIFSDVASEKKSTGSSGKSHQSYEFKQTVDNLHHGLPAHATEEQKRLVGIKTNNKDSEPEEGMSFGVYKPSLGRRGRRASKDENNNKEGFVFGGYNPSIAGEGNSKPVRKNSGLNFGGAKKSEPAKEPTEDIAFGAYNPTFGANRPRRNSNTKQSDEDPFAVGPPRRALNRRRSRGEDAKATSIFGDDLLGVSGPPKPAKPNSFGDDLFKSSSKDTSGDKGYPWENRVNLAKSKDNADDSLLPRRKRMQQASFSTGHQQNVRAVGNALDDVDDEIEEVIL